MHMAGHVWWKTDLININPRILLDKEEHVPTRHLAEACHLQLFFRIPLSIFRFSVSRPAVFERFARFLAYLALLFRPKYTCAISHPLAARLVHTR